MSEVRKLSTRSRGVNAEPQNHTSNTDLHHYLAFLMKLAVLRWLAGFQPTSRNQQADLFRLEACAEQALTA
jgi:hypothetical protein